MGMSEAGAPVEQKVGNGAGRAAEKPVALLLCTNLFFGVQLQSMARAAGFEYRNLRPGDPVQEAEVLVVDLAAQGNWEEAIREAAGRGIPVVAFGPHIDATSRRSAKAAGASRVLANSNLSRDLPVILRGLREHKNSSGMAGKSTESTK
jgi:hypothetical protein